MNPPDETALQQPRLNIVFATIAAGGSHTSSAQAMKESLEANYPGCFESRIRELMLELGFGSLDKRHKEAWRWALAHPWTVVWGQRIIDAVPAASVAVHRRMLRGVAAGAARAFAEDPPSLIVANHGWLTTALSQSRRHFGLRAPVVSFQTSTLDATALWADPDAERFVVGSTVARERLTKLGVPSDRIDVVGYPVRQAFLRAPGKREARCKLGLRDCFTCLVSLGGEGVGGKPKAILGALRELGFPVQVIVVAGRNEDLRVELDQLARQDELLRVEGYVGNMAEFVAASDLVIGKTGPAAVFESLAVGRPVLAPYRSGGIENRMTEFLAANELGGYMPDSTTLKRAVAGYYRVPDRLEAVAARAAALDFSGMARRLAAYLSHYAQTGRPDTSLRGEGIPWSIREAMPVN